MHTACIHRSAQRAPRRTIVVGKNYRLQNIQLSKITDGSLARRDQCPAPFARHITPRLARRAARPAALTRFRCSPLLHQLHRYVVENTGLEPVTSWLQTRRSPS